MKQYTIEVKTSMAFEFIILLEWVANYESLLKHQKKSLPMDLSQSIQNTERLKNQLPTLLEQDIKLLFKEFALTHALITLIEDPLQASLDISVDECIQWIKGTSPDDFFDALLNGMYGIKKGYDPDGLKAQIDAFQHQSMDSILSYKKLMSLKKDIVTIKERLDVTLDAVYPYFKKMEKNLTYELSLASDFFKEASQDSQAFFKQLDYVNLESFEPLKPHIVLYASVNHIGISYHLDEKKDKDEANDLSIIIGICNQFLFQNEDLFKLRLKCLGDDSKMAILMSVKEEPLFAKQLCEKTGLTKGTISHHIEKLLMAKLIEAKKIEGRCVYYGLKEGAIQEISEKLLEDFQ